MIKDLDTWKMKFNDGEICQIVKIFVLSDLFMCLLYYQMSIECYKKKYTHKHTTKMKNKKTKK